jgi:DNA-damage-inducible protein J
MTQDAIVRARINGAIKEEAAHVLAAMGLTVSDAFRLMMIRIAHDKALPFQPLVPNAQTIAAMKQARSGVIEPVTLDALQAVLDEDD